MLYPTQGGALREAIDTSRTLGSDKLWSNETMYKHLSFLASPFTTQVCSHSSMFSYVLQQRPLQNGASSRVIIDTFRSTAMVPSPKKVVVMLENQISAVRPARSRMETVSGIINYAAVVAASSVAPPRPVTHSQTIMSTSPQR